MSVPRALAPLVCLLLWAPAVAGAETPSSVPSALRLEAGAIARHQVVALGRDVTVEGEALSGVTALEGDARILGKVAGGVTVLGGDAELGPEAVVRGDVYVVGGELRMASGARVEGRAVAYPTVSRAWLTLLEGPTLGLSAGSPVVLAAKLALSAAWLVLTLLLFATFGRNLGATAEEVVGEPLRCFWAGLVGLLALTLTALLLSTVLPPIVSVPVLVLIALVALLAKLWGMVAVFLSVGRWLAARAGRPRLLALHAAVAGLLVLAVIKLVPYVGLWVWTAASLIAVGAALRTKFGRREPWFAEPTLAAAHGRS